MPHFRTADEIRRDIKQIQRHIDSLPVQFVNEGYAEDYEGQIDALTDELVRAQELEQEDAQLRAQELAHERSQERAHEARQEEARRIERDRPQEHFGVQGP